MKLAHLLEELESNCRKIIRHYKIDFSAQNHGKTGLMFMHLLLNRVAADLAYDDNHPRYQNIERVIPYDGRDFCWYYSNGANDSHLATLLGRIKKNLIERPENI